MAGTANDAAPAASAELLRNDLLFIFVRFNVKVIPKVRKNYERISYHSLKFHANEELKWPFIDKKYLTP
jgi:hypothetical protein